MRWRCARLHSYCCLHYRRRGRAGAAPRAACTVLHAPHPCCSPACPRLQVNYQFEGPDNRLNDTAVQEAIANGTCFNEQVMLRWPSWQGHGPQAELGLE